MLNINSFDVELDDKIDMKGDIFHIQEDPENPIYFCLVREREGVCVVVDYNTDQSKFNERIINAKRI